MAPVAWMFENHEDDIAAITASRQSLQSEVTNLNNIYAGLAVAPALSVQQGVKAMRVRLQESRHSAARVLATLMLSATILDPSSSSGSDIPTVLAYCATNLSINKSDVPLKLQTLLDAAINKKRTSGPAVHASKKAKSSSSSSGDKKDGQDSDKKVATDSSDKKVAKDSSNKKQAAKDSDKKGKGSSDKKGKGSRRRQKKKSKNKAAKDISDKKQAAKDSSDKKQAEEDSDKKDSSVEDSSVEDSSVEDVSEEREGEEQEEDAEV